MDIELKPIICQLTEALELPAGQRVAALIDDDGRTLVGWTVVSVTEDGTINPLTDERFSTIKDLISDYGKIKIIQQANKIWHDSDKGQPKQGSDVIILNGRCGEVLDNIMRVNPGMQWAYLDDVLECTTAISRKGTPWKSAEGDDLPEIDREVIALLSNGKVVYAHRPPEHWTGTSITTGETKEYSPMRYDKGQWNQPDVKWWLDLPIPNIYNHDENISEN